jgi:hypothetical protein
VDSLPFPKRHRKLPQILSPEEMAKLIDSASNLFHRAILMTCTRLACAAPSCAGCKSATSHHQTRFAPFDSPLCTLPDYVG